MGCKGAKRGEGCKGSEARDVKGEGGRVTKAS
jgi:hypothetical protein